MCWSPCAFPGGLVCARDLLRQAKGVLNPGRAILDVFFPVIYIYRSGAETHPSMPRHLYKVELVLVVFNRISGFFCWEHGPFGPHDMY